MHRVILKACEVHRNPRARSLGQVAFIQEFLRFGCDFLRREKPSNTVRFGNQIVTTKVFLMAPADPKEIVLDVTEYMWEGDHAGVH